MIALMQLFSINESIEQNIKDSAQASWPRCLHRLDRGVIRKVSDCINFI